MRVAFVGNCQAQALEQGVVANLPGIEVEFMRPVWLYQAEHEEEVLSKLDGCDVIFCQRVASDYQVPFVRTDSLKRRYGSRAISWPNVYFDGGFPGVEYIYRQDGSKVVGPLDDYHFDFISESFRLGRSEAECVKYITTDAIFEKHGRPVHASIDALSARERGLDVRMCDFIVQYLGARREFYSMNHPVEFVLSELLVRLFGAAGAKIELKSIAFPYPLSKIILPFFPAIANRFNLRDDRGKTTFKGVPIVGVEEGRIQIGTGPVEYSAEQLVETFYRCYRDAHVF